MKRSRLYPLTGNAVLFALLFALPVSAIKPNIIFILTDDFGYGDCSINNPNSKIKTPHIDALAKGGMRFFQGHSADGVCTPSRYGLLTGRYSWRGRLKENVLQGYDPTLIEHGRMTIASMLKSQGYATGSVGKWHLGMDWTLKKPAAGYTMANENYAKPVHVIVVWTAI